MYCRIVQSEFRSGEPRDASQAAQADTVIRDLRHWSKTPDEDLDRLKDLSSHSSLVHHTLYHVVGAAIALTMRCAYHRRIRADWCQPLCVENADDKSPFEVVTEMAKRLHLDGGDVDVSKLLRAMDQDVRERITHALREQGIELAGPDVFIK